MAMQRETDGISLTMQSGWSRGKTPVRMLIPKYPHQMEVWNVKTLVAPLRISSNATVFFSNFRASRQS
jgi:hypothetical protein